MFRFLSVLFLAFLPLCAKPIVTVSVSPQQFIVEKIAGDTVEVAVMVGNGANHETYEPKPFQMRSLAKSDIYFAIGLPFENIWLSRFKASAPKMSIADISEGIEKISFEEHGETELDPHIWLDPLLIGKASAVVLGELTKKYPQNEALYKQNYENFIKELGELDALISKKLTNIPNRSFLVFHPSWGYFAKRYGLEQLFVEYEGKEPKAAELIAIVKKARAAQIKILLVEPQVSQKAAQVISAEIGAKIVNINPLGEDIFATLRELADILAESD